METVTGETNEATGGAVMAGELSGSELRILELETLWAALDRVQGVIQFRLDGTILDANENFLSVVGYARDEIVGQHHSMLCTQQFATSPNTASSGRRLAAASTLPASSSASASRATMSGSRHPTIP